MSQALSSLVVANNMRINALRMVHHAKASHIGSALSITDILAVLYSSVINFQKTDPLLPSRDRFILSKGHACVAVYAVLAECGFISQDDLMTYGDDFSDLMNHISHKVPGVEFSTGSLGHGLPFAVGKALAAKIKRKAWRSFVLLSDGELDEGSNWEALLFAAHHQLDNLVIIVDYNKLQSLDSIENTLSLEPLRQKFSAFGADVIEVDGHNHDELEKAFNQMPENSPRIVLAHTVKGCGVSFMENKVEWHYRSPDDAALSMALKELGITDA